MYIQQFTSERSDHDEELELMFKIKNTKDYNDTIQLEDTTHGNAEIAEYGFINP